MDCINTIHSNHFPLRQAVVTFLQVRPYFQKISDFNDLLHCHHTTLCLYLKVIDTLSEFFKHKINHF